MRNLINDTPNLFSTEDLLAPPPMPSESVAEKNTEKFAKEFVRWCFSFGSEFRNSPDVTNLRVWSRKAKMKLKSAEEEEVLREARRLFARKLEQTLRKAGGALPEQNTILE